MKFRKKPVVIEAEQTSTFQIIPTLEGAMTAGPGDWIITGVKGERYPCKPDIFEATYEPADSVDPRDHRIAELEKTNTALSILLKSHMTDQQFADVPTLAEAIAGHYKTVSDPLQARIAELEQALAKSQELVTAIGEQLEADRTEVAMCMTTANRAIDQRHWLTEGRGSYEWDDDNWHKEFYAAAVEIKEALSPLTKIAANWKGCPQTSEQIAQARVDLKAALADANDRNKQAESFARGNVGIHWAEEHDRLKEERDALAAAMADRERELAVLNEALDGLRPHTMSGSLTFDVLLQVLRDGSLWAARDVEQRKAGAAGYLQALANRAPAVRFVTTLPSDFGHLGGTKAMQPIRDWLLEEATFLETGAPVKYPPDEIEHGEET